mgnify:CR=1 FL=1
MVLVHTYFVCWSKRNVASWHCELLGGTLEAQSNGITKVAASLHERNVRSGDPVVGINGTLLGHVGVCPGDDRALLFGAGNSLVQESILLLSKEA